jgi:hypothetical protein
LWGVVPGAALLTGLAFLLLPAGIAVAVLKYRLYETDLVINRTLVYGVMTIVVLVGYVAIVGLIGATLSSRGDLFLSLVVTGVVAVCFQPVRERVQRFVDRLMYGDATTPTPPSRGSAERSRHRCSSTPYSRLSSRRSVRHSRCHMLDSLSPTALREMPQSLPNTAFPEPAS